MFVGVLKDYLRELPDPLMPPAMVERVMTVLAGASPDDPVCNGDDALSVMEVVGHYKVRLLLVGNILPLTLKKMLFPLFPRLFSNVHAREIYILYLFLFIVMNLNCFNEYLMNIIKMIIQILHCTLGICSLMKALKIENDQKFRRPERIFLTFQMHDVH